MVTAEERRFTAYSFKEDSDADLELHICTPGFYWK